MKHPNFFIVGAPKCGTTSLAAWLSTHPRVYISKVKEPHYYSTDLDYGSHRERDRYLELFEAACEGDLAVGEASPYYLYSDDAIPAILTDAPDAKFIVMLRDPVEMVHSLFEQMRFAGHEDEESFQRAWDLQDARRRGEHLPRWCAESRILMYGDICRTGWQLERVFERVARDRVLPILLEDVRHDTRGVWLNVMSFLGVPDDDRHEFPVLNKAKGRRSQWLKRLIDAQYRIRTRLGIPAFNSGVFTALDSANVREQDRSALPVEFENELAAYFEEDTRKLADLLGRNLDHWTRPTSPANE